MPHIETSTITIHCTDEGPRDAPAILFSNSLGASLDMWRDQAMAFAQDYRVIRYDQRGHGQTDVPPGPYSFEALCDDAVALLDALGVERAHVVGLSMGGMTALGLAIDHAERVASITACNCVAGYGPEALAIWDERMAIVASKGLDAVLDGTLERWFTQPTRDARPDDMTAVRAMIAATPRDGYLGCCGALKQLAYTDRLSRITVPCLFVAGTHDAGAPAAAMRDMHAAVAHSRYVELDAAHVSNIERPAEFNRAVAAFLGSV